MKPVPEPPGDIRAQLAAVLDPSHPKLACFMVPDDAANLKIPEEGIPGLIVVRRAEGVLVTTDRTRAEMFREAADETTMAQILGYPEAKDLIAERCPKPPGQTARCVQARTRTGHVITEACCSGIGLLPTVAELRRHVPPDGDLVIMSPVASIARRIALRWIGH
jgi:hypothetical protein